MMLCSSTSELVKSLRCQLTCSSGHGTQTEDLNGDEGDDDDEGELLLL